MVMEDLELLYLVLTKTYGVALEVSDMTTALRHLYKARADSADPALSVIQFRKSPFKPESELWIVKRPQNATS